MTDSNQKILERAFDRYSESVYRLARNEFYRAIKPFMEKKGYRFIAGMGDWMIAKDGIHLYDKEKYIPKRLLKILDQDIPGMPANSLGTLMPDYIPEGDYKE